MLGRCGEQHCGHNCGMCYEPTYFTPMNKLENGYMHYSREWLERHAKKCNMSIEQYIHYWEASGLAPDASIY